MFSVYFVGSFPLWPAAVVVQFDFGHSGYFDVQSVGKVPLVNAVRFILFLICSPDLLPVPTTEVVTYVVLCRMCIRCSRGVLVLTGREKRA